MTLAQKIYLPFLAAALLSACKPKPAPTPPVNPSTTATFEIRAVLHDRSGNPSTRPNSQYVLGEDIERFTDNNGIPLFVLTDTTIDTSCLKSISAGEAYHGGAVLNFRLTADCAKTFGEFTERNIGKRMAVIINGEMLTSPSIRTAILGGSGYIEGGFKTLAEAEAIAKAFYE